MSKAYHGTDTYKLIKPQAHGELLLVIEAHPKDLNFIRSIVETHCHTALPVLLDPSGGRMGFHTTADKKEDLLQILKSLPRPLKIIT